MPLHSAGAAFRKALQEESPLQIVGAINAHHALLAKRAGFMAIYLSGGGVAAGSLGIPDLGISVGHRGCEPVERHHYFNTDAKLQLFNTGPLDWPTLRQGPQRSVPVSGRGRQHQVLFSRGYLASVLPNEGFED